MDCIEFGHGDKVIVPGTYFGQHCLIVTDARYNDYDVGDDAEHEFNGPDDIGDNPFFIVTNNQKRAELLYLVLTGKLDGLDIG